jgi:hypothetical protein
MDGFDAQANQNKPAGSKRLLRTMIGKRSSGSSSACPAFSRLARHDDARAEDDTSADSEESQRCDGWSPTSFNDKRDGIYFEREV